jgi:hypothetical protein
MPFEFQYYLTKDKIEHVLTGVITTHTHSGISGATFWGLIGGSLVNQTDLMDEFERRAAASAISLDTLNFTKNLGLTDNTVQKAMETLDELTSGGSASATSVIATGFVKNLPTTDNTVQKALTTIDGLTLGEVTSSSTIGDNKIVRGDGGVKGIQGSGISMV